MTTAQPNTHFAFDCGATNWRLYRASYRTEDGRLLLASEPKPSPLTSFSDRKLPAAVFLSPDGENLESFGEEAQQRAEDETQRERLREYFKPCIGAHLLEDPLPHQQRYTHAEALRYTKLLLHALIDQLRREKWRSGAFDERVYFVFAHPVHWRMDHGGELLEAFAETVRACLPERTYPRVRFVAEPEGAILSLQHQGLLSEHSKGITLIADIGGSTTDLVAGIVDEESGIVNYLGRYGDPFGGGLFDAELAKHFADELGIPVSVMVDDPSAMISLRLFARRLKESLSRQLLHPERGDFVAQRTLTLVTCDGEVFRRLIKLNEARFNNIAQHLSHRFEALISEGMHALRLQEHEIGQVALVGGGAQLFTIVEHLRARFGDAKVILADYPEECVAAGISLEYGAALARARPSLIFESPLKPTPSRQEKAATKPADVKWYLVSEEKIFPIDSQQKSTVGRGGKNPVSLNSDKVSRLHAELQASENGVLVLDQGSTNGTFINEQRLTPGVPSLLQVHDRVRFGDQSFTLQCQALRKQP